MMGNPAYMWALLEMIRGDMVKARINFKVDRCMVRRDPADPTKILKKETTKRNNRGEVRTILWNIMVNIPDRTNEDRAKFRASWRSLFVRLYNSNMNQAKLYGQNTLAYDAGDLTPNGQNAKLPYLSDYLTIKHTIDVLEYAFSQTKTRDEIVADDVLLKYYFPANMLDMVRDNEAQYKARNQNFGDWGDTPTFNDEDVPKFNG